REVGLVYATNALAATLAPPAIGWLADRHFSANRLLTGLSIVAAFALIACFYATSFPVFYGLILLFNLSFIPTYGLLAGVCFHQLEDPEKSFPLVRVWGTVSFMLVGMGLSYFGVETSALPLLVAAVVCVGMALVASTLPPIPPQKGFDWRSLRGGQVTSILREPGMVVLFVAMLLSCIPASFYYSFLNPFLNEIGWSNAAAKMSLGQMGEIFVVLAMPFAFRKLRFRQIVFWGILVWGLRYFAFSVARPGYYEWLLYAGILVQGIAFAWIVIATQIYIDKRVPIALRSTAQGLVSFGSQGLGVFIGSWIAGEVVLANTVAAGEHAWEIIWLVPGAVGLLTAIWFWGVFPRQTKLEG
ncbi:MAG: MFS transporter, partial [Bacteroidota bacterium]